MNDRRMPAEWENPARIMLALPGQHTDWAYILEEAADQYDRLLRSLESAGERVLLLDGDFPYNDTWTRDYGPLSVIDGGRMLELDFGFNGWGLKFAADKDNLVNLRMAEQGLRNEGAYRNHRDFILEGGSIESDGKGTILTTSRCLCSPNRNGGKSKDEITRILHSLLGAERVLWVDHGFLAGDDTDSHIDTLARLAPCDTILYVMPPEDKNDVHFAELSAMEQQLKGFRTAGGSPFRLVGLPFPDAIYDEDGMRLPATYANYLVTGKNVFVPVYNQPEKDRRAVEAIGGVFPSHCVHTVDCRTLIRQHGSLHCSTMQLYY